MIVVDTNVLSEPLRPVPDSRVMAWLAVHAGDLALTSVTVGELLYGARRLDAGRRRDGLLAAIDELIRSAGERVLSYNAAAAREFADLRVSREARGLPVSVEDTMIAAICRAGGHELATRNVRDFADAGIALHNPWDEG